MTSSRAMESYFPDAADWPTVTSKQTQNLVIPTVHTAATLAAATPPLCITVTDTPAAVVSPPPSYLNSATAIPMTP